MNFKAISCIALAALTIFSASACKKEEKKKAEINIDTEDEYIRDILVEDYDGYNFRILTRKTMMADQYVEEETGDIITDAVFKRNETVKALLNCEITATESSSSGGETDALSSILAGDDQYDLIFPHSRSSFQYAIQNTLINYNEVDTIHLDKPWWSKDIIDSCNVNGHLYVSDGDIATHRLNFAMTMYFNKTLFDELGFEYPYEMVLDGKWTFDQFAKLVKKGSKDLNGDGVMTPADDQYGFYSSCWQSPISIIYTGGQRIYNKDAKGIPQLTLNTSKTVDIFTEYFDLVDSDDVFVRTETPSSGYGATYTGTDIFTSGRALFTDRGLGSAKSMRSMNDDFGIIPLPKFTEDDNYATIVNGHASLMLMPITVEDENRTGNIAEALCAIGSKEVIPAFYEVSLKTKFARDAESEEMIDIIKDSIIYDLGYVSGGTFQSIGRDLLYSGGEFSSRYASNESAALQKLKEFNKSYGKVG